MSRASGEVARDAKVIGLVGVAHFFSHFFQLVLPPLFPFIRGELGFSYTALGAVATVFYVFSGVLQTPAGFLVDRIGARPVLLGGLGLLAGATALYGLVSDYWSLMALAAVAGAGNSVFHPADYSILSARVREARMGRAFGVHVFGGYAGYAAAPVTVVALASLFDWRIAASVSGLVGLAVFALLVAERHELGEGTAEQRHARHQAVAAGPPALTVFLQTAVLMCFLFFMLSAMGQIGLFTFTPAALGAMSDMSVALAGSMVSAFLVGAMLGILAGGALADRYPHHHVVAGLGMAGAAVAFPVIALVALPPAVLMALFALSGVVFGVVQPSRDLLVRAAAPQGATGKVFGFVYSALDVGAALAPVTFGWLIDRGVAPAVFLSVAILFALAALTVAATHGARLRARVAAPGE